MKSAREREIPSTKTIRTINTRSADAMRKTIGNDDNEHHLKTSTSSSAEHTTTDRYRIERSRMKSARESEIPSTKTIRTINTRSAGTLRKTIGNDDYEHPLITSTSSSAEHTSTDRYRIERSRMKFAREREIPPTKTIRTINTRSAGSLRKTIGNDDNEHDFKTSTSSSAEHNATDRYRIERSRMKSAREREIPPTKTIRTINTRSADTLRKTIGNDDNEHHLKTSTSSSAEHNPTDRYRIERSRMKSARESEIPPTKTIRTINTRSADTLRKTIGNDDNEHDFKTSTSSSAEHNPTDRYRIERSRMKSARESEIPPTKTIRTINTRSADAMRKTIVNDDNEHHLKTSTSSSAEHNTTDRYHIERSRMKSARGREIPPTKTIRTINTRSAGSLRKTIGNDDNEHDLKTSTSSSAEHNATDRYRIERSRMKSAREREIPPTKTIRTINTRSADTLRKTIGNDDNEHHLKTSTSSSAEHNPTDRYRIERSRMKSAREREIPPTKTIRTINTRSVDAIRKTIGNDDNEHDFKTSTSSSAEHNPTDRYRIERSRMKSAREREIPPTKTIRTINTRSADTLRKTIGNDDNEHDFKTSTSSSAEHNPTDRYRIERSRMKSARESEIPPTKTIRTINTRSADAMRKTIVNDDNEHHLKTSTSSSAEHNTTDRYHIERSRMKSARGREIPPTKTIRTINTRSADALRKTIGNDDYEHPLITSTSSSAEHNATDRYRIERSRMKSARKREIPPTKTIRTINTRSAGTLRKTIGNDDNEHDLKTSTSSSAEHNPTDRYRIEGAG
uniref:Mucin-5AC-like n=1 Tax=Crassostrea virginica TaxID=6565 RepID=A0A8B8AUN3_CRAVI|nr:mucin-5AC-like [Crassostrea virginica]